MLQSVTCCIVLGTKGHLKHLAFVLDVHRPPTGACASCVRGRIRGCGRFHLCGFGRVADNIGTYDRVFRHVGHACGFGRLADGPGPSVRLSPGEVYADLDA